MPVNHAPQSLAMHDSRLPLAASHSLVRPALQLFATVGMSVAFAGLNTHGAARAQSELPAPAAAASDRAKRDADKVYELIRMHADRPRKPAVTAAGSAPMSAVSKPGDVDEVREPVRPVIAKLSVAPNLPRASAESRAGLHADVERSIGVQIVAVGSSTAPALAAVLSVTQVSTPAELTPGRAIARAAPEVPENTLTLVSSVDPNFPAHLVRRLVQGAVVVNFEVQPDGSVGAMAIERTRHEGLNAAALAAVAAWRFKPVSKITHGVTELRFD